MAPFDFAPLALRYAQDERCGSYFRSPLSCYLQDERAGNYFRSP
ncbi:MAG: hypothetical protein OXK20_00700 [Deltaproteobacteria bacterium]|nr:hypothetical protein [Deltaproteobacteria bacterium]